MPACAAFVNAGADLRCLSVRRSERSAAPSSGKLLFEPGNALGEARQLARHGLQQPQAVEEGASLPIVVRLLEAGVDDAQEAVLVAAIELDLGEVEEAPWPVVRRALARLELSHVLRPREGAALGRLEIEPALDHRAQLQRVQKRIGVPSGRGGRALVGLMRLLEALRALQHA